MTIEEIRRRVEEIRLLQVVDEDEIDWEAVHNRVDDLFVDVLRAIAGGVGLAAQLAVEALAARDHPRRSSAPER